MKTDDKFTQHNDGDSQCADLLNDRDSPIDREGFSRSVIEHSPVGISVRSAKGKLLSVNAAWKKIWQLSDEQVAEYMAMEPSDLDFTDAEERLGKWLPEIIRVYSEGGLLRIPQLYLTEDRSGLGRWVSMTYYTVNDDEGKVERVVTLTDDITERKQFEEALQISEAKFRTYINNAPTAIMVIDDSGRYLEVNDAACRLTGYSADELEQMTIADLADPAQAEQPRADLDELKRVGYRSCEIRMRRKDGQILWVAQDAVALPEGGFIGFQSDVTETKRLQELESRAQRLEAAGRIAGQVAHDFNNLLGPIMAYPDLIRDELRRNHPALPYLRDIEKAAEQMAEINQQLLTLARRGHYIQEITNLNEIVLQVINDQRSSPETLVWESDLAADLLNINAGPAQLSRAIFNLLGNARDAVGDIGVISIKTENYYVDEVTLAHLNVPRGEYVKVTISDDGHGIVEDILDKIFDPFFTTKSTDKQRGSGLGLSVVQAVVEDHSGYIDLNSTVGEGTAFYLYFPVTRAESEPARRCSAASGTESVLVVDDDPVQRKVTVRLLSSLGYRAESVDSGTDALALLKETPFDLLILDMVMPGELDGTDTYLRALEFAPDQRAVLVSGFAESDRVEKAIDSGAGAFIKKPLTRHQLALAVRSELDRKS
jgi:PAS domain S-box-containing protein